MDRQQVMRASRELVDDIDQMIENTEKATFRWWNELHMARHAMMAAIWIAEQVEPKAPRSNRDWALYVWEFAADEQFMTDVPYRWHMDAMRHIEIEDLPN